MPLKITVKQGDITEAKADVVVVNLFEGVETPGGATGAVDAATGGAVKRLLALGDFKGKFKETVMLYPDGLATKRLMIVGLGEQQKFTLDRARQVAARVAKRARDAGCRSAATIVNGAGSALTARDSDASRGGVAGIGGLDAEQAARALAEGATLALYKFRKYKSKPKETDEPEKELAELVVYENAAENLAGVRKGAAAGSVVAECVNMTRDWATYSGDDAWPANLAKDAQKMARDADLKFLVFDDKKMRDLGMGGVLAVARGSPHAPRFVILEHGTEHKSKGTLVLVGKGVTFDSGGISIKPAEKMDEMKFDKAGAAAVWGAMRAIAKLGVKAHVVGLTPLAENMPSGDAMKPGDVFTAYNGKTFEVLNTDAEGRLILADALAYAANYEPAAIVDVATLTGHVVVALGGFCSGVMGNDAEFMARFKRSAEHAHERVAEFPFFEEYGELLKGGVADVKNHAGRPGGAITAGKFLEAFVPENVPWIHLDIAGTGWQSGGQPFNEEYSPGAATGVGVRTFVDLAERWAADPPKGSAAAKPRPRSAKR